MLVLGSIWDCNRKRKKLIYRKSRHLSLFGLEKYGFIQFAIYTFKLFLEKERSRKSVNVLPFAIIINRSGILEFLVIVLYIYDNGGMKTKVTLSILSAAVFSTIFITSSHLSGGIGTGIYACGWVGVMSTI
jgi:hypothetical protein